MKTRRFSYLLVSTVLALTSVLASLSAKAQEQQLELDLEEVNQEKMLIRMKNPNGETAAYLEVPVKKDPNADLKEMYADMKLRARQKDFFQMSMLKRTAVRFPIDAGSFGFAISAVTAYNLSTDYAKDPAGWDHFIQSQTDIPGQLGFFGFMMGSEATRTLIGSSYHIRHLKPLTPFLGMAVGMSLSHLIGEIGHFPGLKECVAERYKYYSKARFFSNPDPKFPGCENAYKNWVELKMSEKMHEMAPTFASLFASAFVAGKVHSYGTKLSVVLWDGAKRFGKPILKAVGFAAKKAGPTPVKVIANVPTFMQMLKVNMIHTTLFMFSSEFLSAPLTYWYNKFHHTHDLNKASLELNKTYTELSRISGENQNKNAASSVEKFTKSFAKWQEGRNRELITAYANWNDYVVSFLQVYSSAFKLYQNLIGSIKSIQDGTVNKEDSPLYFTSKLGSFAETVLVSRPQNHAIYITNPKNGIIPAQIKIANEIARRMNESLLNSKSETYKFYSRLVDKDKSFLKQILSLLEKSDEASITSAITTLRKYQNSMSGSVTLQLFITNHLMKEYELGEEINRPGEWYKRYIALTLQTTWPKTKELGLQENIMGIETPTLFEYLIVSMIHGGQIGTGEFLLRVLDGSITNSDEHLFKNRSGWKVQFYPPKILANGKLKITTAFNNKWTNIFDGAVELDLGNNKKIVSKSLFQLLADGGVSSFYYSPIKDDITKEVGADGFTWTWNTKVIPQFVQVWKKLEVEYNAIVSRVQKHVFSEPQKSLSFSGSSAFACAKMGDCGQVTKSIKTSFNEMPFEALKQENQLYFDLLTKVLRTEMMRLGKAQQAHANQMIYDLLSDLDMARKTQFSLLKRMNSMKPTDDFTAISKQIEDASIEMDKPLLRISQTLKSISMDKQSMPIFQPTSEVKEDLKKFYWEKWSSDEIEALLNKILAGFQSNKAAVENIAHMAKFMKANYEQFKVESEKETVKNSNTGTEVDEQGTSSDSDAFGDFLN